MVRMQSKVANIVLTGKTREGKHFVYLNGATYFFKKITSKRNNQFMIKAESVLTKQIIIIEITGDKDFNILLQ